ncbi:prephenate dehydratase [Corynebacterium tapiri]|uniref:Prephenate dehydratase n=1 Tax=Corynebacterium tapiri TaxID=1448266 RepID=A0A5C4U3M1_9CORY|nr:prephenate dehydratase [Corynebacterium tapiri]TNL95602.1 prephenate dehydratase [Corynebacterium tapiri]
MQTTVAYLGPEGTFTETALLAFTEAGAFSHEVRPLPVNSPAEALDAVRAGEAEYAVVAIENSVDGAVTGTYDALVDGGHDVQIFYEHEVDIAFSVMTRPDTAPEKIRTLTTHPIAYQQIRHWLKDNLPGVEFVAASSNAAAARMVAEGKADAAAAPARAADIYGLTEIARGVADERGARTRFVVVGKRAQPTPRTGNDTTLVVFTLNNEPGTLGAALQDFSLRGINLSRIASRPTVSEPGSYLFYVDFVGHIDDQPLAEALRALWLRSQDIAFLGSWPSARPRDTDSEFAATLQRLDQANAWVEQARRGGAD